MFIHTRQAGAILPRILGCVVFFTLLFPLIANAGIEIKVYGRGGIRIYPPAICPEPSQDLCAEIKISTWGASEGEVDDPYSSNRYRVVFGEPIPPNTYEVQGSDLVLESIEPIE